MARIPYNKPHLPIPDQLALLKARGLEITDDGRAGEYLRRIGYYRLSGYWYPMRATVPVPAPAPGAAPFVVLDDFKPGAKFSDVVDLYVFDKKLRMLVLDAIERIEVALRVDLALHLGRLDPVAHRNAALLHPNFAVRINANGRTKHADWITRLDHAESRSSEDFVRHFRANYSTGLPIWIAIELWDFGMMSHLIAGLRHPELTAMAARFGLPRGELLASWVRAINHVRNVCAHHSRLWNRSIVDEPKATKHGEIATLDHLVLDPKGRARLYGVMVALRFFLLTVNPSSTWASRLADHWKTFPNSPLLDARASGFPKGWDALPLWR